MVDTWLRRNPEVDLSTTANVEAQRNRQLRPAGVGVTNAGFVLLQRDEGPRTNRGPFFAR